MADRTQEARERAEFTPSQKAAMQQIGLEIGAERAVERMIVAEARVSTLETALRAWRECWPQHRAECLFATYSGCTCGLDEAREITRAALAEGDTTADQNVTPDKAT